MRTSPLPGGTTYQATYSAGLLEHLPAVVAQFIQARSLQPLRVLLLGPPYAGKPGHLAAGHWPRGTPSCQHACEQRGR